jgi:hypothetical protein
MIKIYPEHTSVGIKALQPEDGKTSTGAVIISLRTYKFRSGQ